MQKTRDGRRRFSREFKIAAVRRVLEGEPMAAVARDLNIGTELLWRWERRVAEKGEEHLYREEKYAAVYEINMLRCIFCGMCEEACPKDAVYLTDRILPSNYKRNTFIYGKDLLVEGIAPEDRIDVSNRKKEYEMET